MPDEAFPKLDHLKDVQSFLNHVRSLGLEFPCDPYPPSPMPSALAAKLDVEGFTVGNRWCIHPMEGWDGTLDGQPTEHTLRRWQHFGLSGAKLIWGGEAFAVQNDARANPNQLGLIDDDLPRAERGLAALLGVLRQSHRQAHGTTDDLLIGLQLTHSGRFSRPYNQTRLEPKIAYHHPLLDRRFNISANDDSTVVSDDYLERLVERFIQVAKLAQRVGFQFVDVKHCHGYLGHELLSAFTRPGKFGGDLDGRTRFVRLVVQGIQAACPSLKIGVRFSAFDHPPFYPDPSRGGEGKLGPGIPQSFAAHLPYRFAFGCNPENPLEIDLTEPIAFCRLLGLWGVKLLNVSCCSPYYNPHFQRPAAFPPSDGYQPPEDPLIGVARQMRVVRDLKAACGGSIFVGSGYSYLQEYLPHVAQGAVRQGWVDAVGIGRMVLSYWDLPADVLAGREIQVKRLCRTFSDCTTAPRNGLISGCFPHDAYYKESGAHDSLVVSKAEIRQALRILDHDGQRGVPG